MLWRLTFVNSLIITTFILLLGWAIYEATCKIVDEVVVIQEGKIIKDILLQYIGIFVVLFTAFAVLLQYFFTRHQLQPLRVLMESMEKLKQGKEVQYVHSEYADEINALMEQFNELVNQLEGNKKQRHQRLSEFSHEFRTPLTNINGYLMALQTGVISGNPELFQALHQESKRLILMVEQLKSIEELTYAEQQKYLQKQDIEIVDVIYQVIQMFSLTMKSRNIAFHVELEQQMLEVNPYGLSQIMSNLIDNAIRYYEGTKPIEIVGKRMTGFYVISVSGQGKFISETEKSLIFERFYRVEAISHSIAKEAGLGLAITKQIVEQHEGTISLLTDGTYHTFLVKLPLRH